MINGNPKISIKVNFFQEAAGFISAALENYKILFADYPKSEEITYFFSEIYKKD